LTRVKQGNLVGPAGYISMEDGCVGGSFSAASPVHRQEAVLEMGGSEARAARAGYGSFPFAILEGVSQQYGR